MMLRLLILCYVCVTASCSITTNNPAADRLKSSKIVNTGSTEDKSTPSPDAGELPKSAQQLNTLTHQFEPTELQTLFSEAITQVESTLGTNLSGVKLVIDNQLQRKKVIARQLKESQHIRPNVATNSILPDSTQAIYDRDSDTVFFHPDIEHRFPPLVGSSRKLAREYLRFVMLHELVHASDARKGRINLRWPSIRTMTNAAYVREGHAHYWSKTMCRQSGCQMFVEKQKQSSEKDKIISFYDVGEKFIAGLMAIDASGALIDTAFRQPPSNEYQIIFPELYPDEARDQNTRRITEAVVSAKLPWQTGDYTALTINTIDTRALQRTAIRSARKQLKQLANITMGDSAVSFVKANTSTRQNITVQVLETDTRASANRAYQRMEELHASARGIGRMYRITPQPWNTNTGSRVLGIDNGRNVEVRYFSGTTGKSPDSVTDAPFSLDITLAHADRYIVRILNINATHNELIEASESVLLNLLNTTPLHPIQ